MISRETSLSREFASSRSEILIRPLRDSSFRSKILRQLSLIDINLTVHALISIIQLISMSQPGTLHIWTISYLFINLIVVSSVILVNYFPYQVLIDADDTDRFDPTGFLIPRTHTTQTHHQTPRLILKQPRESLTDDASMIDSVFFEHKQHLKSQALSNKSLSFGVDQPSMQSAYRASTGFVLFGLSSLFILIGLRLLSPLSWSLNSLLLTSILVISLTLIAFVSVFFYLLKNHRETIYRKNLFYKSLLFPYVQLGLVFFSLFGLVCFSLVALWVFLAQLGVLVVILALCNRIVYKRRVAKMIVSAAKIESSWENTIGEPLEMNVFTIDTRFKRGETSEKSIRGQIDASNIEVKVTSGDDEASVEPVRIDFDESYDDDEDEISNNFESAIPQRPMTRDQTSNGMRKIGSETSNINLLI